MTCLGFSVDDRQIHTVCPIHTPDLFNNHRKYEYELHLGIFTVNKQLKYKHI